MKKLILAAVMLVVPLTASAQWVVKSEDDVFSGGKKATLIATINGSLEQGLVFDCTKDSLNFSYIEKGTELGKTSVAMKMLTKVDSGEIINFDASSKARNSEYSSVESSDIDQIKQLLSQAAKAKSRILLGITVPSVDFKQSFTVDVVGSTSAIAKFTSACGIELLTN